MVGKAMFLVWIWPGYGQDLVVQILVDCGLNYYPGLVMLPVGSRTGPVRTIRFCKRRCIRRLQRDRRSRFHQHGQALEESGL